MRDLPLSTDGDARSDFELTCVLAAIVGHRHDCFAAGAVAFAREIIEEARSQDPSAYASHVRHRIAAAQRRAWGRM
jgi:hypothetical protein